MNIEETLTYRDAVKNVHAWAREAYDDDPGDPYPSDTAHEQIDGCEYVIYYHKARTLFFDSSEVSEYESELEGLVGADDTIDQRIALCVYLALRQEWMEAWEACESNAKPTETDDEETDQ